MACGESSCTTTPMFEWASFRKSGVVPKREARLIAAMPRTPSGA